MRVPCSPRGIVADETVRITLIGTYRSFDPARADSFQKHIIWTPEEEQGIHTQRRRMEAPSLTPKKNQDDAPGKDSNDRGPHRLQACAIGPESGYFAALRRSLGVASQRSWPLGGTRRVSSTRATPAFFSEVM